MSGDENEAKMMLIVCDDNDDYYYYNDDSIKFGLLAEFYSRNDTLKLVSGTIL